MARGVRYGCALADELNLEPAPVGIWSIARGRDAGCALGLSPLRRNFLDARKASLMNISDLISKLSSYPAGARVTLLDPDKGWLLPIEILHLSADSTGCGLEFVAITADSSSDEIEGLFNCKPCGLPAIPLA
jgi:hypothetical protein